MKYKWWFKNLNNKICIALPPQSIYYNTDYLWYDIILSLDNNQASLVAMTSVILWVPKGKKIHCLFSEFSAVWNTIGDWL